MLQKVISDKKFCWEGKDIKIDDINISLSEAAINAMRDFVEDNYTYYNEKNFGEESFRSKALKLDIIKDEIDNLKEDYLIKGPGIVILNKILPDKYISLDQFDSNFNGSMDKWKNHKNKIKMAVAVISHHLGILQLQGAKNENEKQRRVYVREIKDRGMSYKSGDEAHYSDTKHGGDYHTDGAERPFPIPRFVTLLCIRQSNLGGETIIKSIYPVHNNLLKNNIDLLKRLYENYYWDRRGSNDKNETNVFEKPIFSYSESNDLVFTYLRKYIESGYLIKQKKMTAKDIDSLNILDKNIADESLYLSLKLRPGNILINNNYFTIHGRPKSGFKDSNSDYNKKRLLIRTWIQDKV